jgi:SPX domain protein involved in polyphosphate accumulation
MYNPRKITRIFNRTEIKYMLTTREAALLQKACLSNLKPDERCNPKTGYPISSVYFDSPEYRCYTERLNEVASRRKLRIRYYPQKDGFRDDSFVLVEIKQRNNHLTQKRRVALPCRDAMSLCVDRQLIECDLEDESVVNEVISFIWQYDLKPVSLIRYQRQAWGGTDMDEGLRVTFDSELEYQVAHSQLFKNSTYIALFPTDAVIMEIKYNQRIPSWLSDLVTAMDLHPRQISKYCQSIDQSKLILQSLLPFTVSG